MASKLQGGSMTFELRITMGNEAMSSPGDVIDALRRVAQMKENGGYEGWIMDNNGNTVGEYRYVQGARPVPHVSLREEA
jgi:hypothetical protein